MYRNKQYLKPSQILKTQYLKQDSQTLKQIGLSWMEVLVKKIMLWDLKDHTIINCSTIATIIQSKFSLQTNKFLIFLGKRAIEECEKYQQKILKEILSAICEVKSTNNIQQVSIINLSDYHPTMKTDLTSQSQAIQKQLNSYLSNILIPNTQMNIFCQKMKIDFPIFNISHNEEMYDVVGTITLPDTITDKNLVYSATARYPQLKNCKNSVSLSLLTQIFNDHLKIWQSFLQKKQKAKRTKLYF